MRNYGCGAAGNVTFIKNAVAKILSRTAKRNIKQLKENG